MHLGQTLVDPSGLYLHSGHALCVTEAHALSHTGLSELTIPLLGRWGGAHLHPEGAAIHITLPGSGGVSGLAA